MSRSVLIAASLLILAVVAGFTASRAQDPKAKASPSSRPQLNTLEEQASYAIGLDIGKSFQRDKLPLNPELVARGLIDGLRQAQPLLTDEQIQDCMTKFSQQQQARKTEESKVSGDRSMKDGQSFLAANKAKQGVQTTPSGLQFQVLKAGNGATPKATDVVRVHYHGTLTDGSVFDSSVQRNEPAEFPVNRVIPGWTEALQKMKVGDKWHLTIPAELAYGARGTPGGPIPPNAVLVFEVELLDIVK